jgi:hypothetical protein
METGIRLPGTHCVKTLTCGIMMMIPPVDIGEIMILPVEFSEIPTL